MEVQGNEKDDGKPHASDNVDPEDNEAHDLEGWDDDEDYKDSEDEGTEEEKQVRKKRRSLLCPQLEGESNEDYRLRYKREAQA
eukprot:scaffold5678_cov101-Amphora_coffeaeformis.AAC.1